MQIDFVAEILTNLQNSNPLFYRFLPVVLGKVWGLISSLMKFRRGFSDILSDNFRVGPAKGLPEH